MQIKWSSLAFVGFLTNAAASGHQGHRPFGGVLLSKGELRSSEPENFEKSLYVAEVRKSPALYQLFVSYLQPKSASNNIYKPRERRVGPSFDRMELLYARSNTDRVADLFVHMQQTSRDPWCFYFTHLTSQDPLRNGMPKAWMVALPFDLLALPVTLPLEVSRWVMDHYVTAPRIRAYYAALFDDQQPGRSHLISLQDQIALREHILNVQGARFWEQTEQDSSTKPYPIL